MFPEQIQTVVFNDQTDAESAILEIRRDGDVLYFVLEGTPIFSGDWTCNFAPLFERIVEMWTPFREDRS